MDRGREFQLLLFLIFKCGSALKPIPIVRPSPETERRGFMLSCSAKRSAYPRGAKQSGDSDYSQICGAARPANALDVRFTPKSRHRLSVSGCPLCAKSGHCGARRVKELQIATSPESEQVHLCL